MANALEEARQALEAARGKITEWDRAIEQARTDRAEAEKAAPADPAELDQYADTYSRAAGKIRAAEQGRKVAASAELAALEGMVRAGLEDARAELRAAESAYAEHRRKLDVLLAKVSALDGADYRPIDLDDFTKTERLEGLSVKTSRAKWLEADVHKCAKAVERHEIALDSEPYSGDRGEYPAYIFEYVDARREAGIASPAEQRQAEQVERDRLAEAREAERAEEGRSRKPWRTRASLGGRRSTGVLPG